MFQVNGVLVENGVRRLTRNVRRATHVVVFFIPPSSSAVPVSRVLRINLKLFFNISRYCICVQARRSQSKTAFSNLEIIKIRCINFNYIILCLVHNALIRCSDF